MKNFTKTLGLVQFTILCFNISWSQSAVNTFLKPSDTLNVARRNAVIIAESAFFIGGIIQMNKPFEGDYLSSKFHFSNDNGAYLGMDKAAHVFSSYHIGSLGANALKWSGVSKRKQLIYGAGMGFAFLTTVEFIDGFAKKGTSYGDIIANGGGASLYVAQELLWKEQRIIPKFSFETTEFFSLSPGKMKSRITSEFNEQTYWLSINLHSFFKDSKIPKWLNLAVGYGAEGIDSSDKFLVGSPYRYRQIYLSVDVDLTKIHTKSHFLKTIFYVFNSIKIPAPTIEYSRREGFKGQVLHF
jgi:hypothetical protein